MPPGTVLERLQPELPRRHCSSWKTSRRTDYRPQQSDIHIEHDNGQKMRRVEAKLPTI
jgi:hypothetical protein